MHENCQEYVLSENIAELLISTNNMSENILNKYQGVCYQQISDRFYTIYTPYDRIAYISRSDFFYGIYPKLYTPMSTAALEISGITRLSNQPSLNLKGQGVIIGIVDTGIDYTHPAFLDEFGQTRILKIWDQTVEDGPAPYGIFYGTEYTAEDINLALSNPDPLSIVKTTDEVGHGTFLAGVAGGSRDDIYNFVGAAPEAMFVIVKLKPAKMYLRNYYFALPDIPCYQENDIMLGINYLRMTALDANLPMSIAFGLGSNLGGHSGSSFLANTVEAVSYFPGACISVPTGNDGLAGRHYHGYIPSSSASDTMEISVGADVDGIILEIWGQMPSVLSVAITSPTGERISRVPARLGTAEEISLIFEQTEIVIFYGLVESFTGDEIIAIRMERPSEGIWQIHVFSDMNETTFDAFIPASSLIGDKTFFLKPSPNTTLLSPSSVNSAISVSGYDPISGAFYMDSGRGFTRLGRYKPDLCAPCTSITVPNLRGGYENRSGTSLAAALTAGACAQFLTWAVTYNNAPLITANDIRTYLIRGAIRDPAISYPSVQWGYGTLDVYNSFEVLRRGGV